MDDVDQAGSELYFVQSWVPGKTLTEIVGGTPRALDDGIRLTVEVARVIARCHERGVYHRDIKPDNIILTSDGALYVVDFGIAWVDPRFGEHNGERTARGQELGNRFLRLPEFAPGEDQRDQRADVTFVVGILFYLLTGTAPRMLLNAAGMQPHEANEFRFRSDVREDPRWPRLRGLFRVGFQVAAGYRIQTCTALLSSLNELLEPPVEPKVVTDDAVADFEELMASGVLQQRQTIEKAMISVSRELENGLRRRAVEIGLQPVGNAGGPYLTDGGTAVELYYSIYRKDAHDPQASLRHRIALDPHDRSQITVSYQIDDTWSTYYRGFAADTEKLSEVVQQNEQLLFGRTLSALTSKLKHQLAMSRTVSAISSQLGSHLGISQVSSRLLEHLLLIVLEDPDSMPDVDECVERLNISADQFADAVEELQTLGLATGHRNANHQSGYVRAVLRPVALVRAGPFVIRAVDLKSEILGLLRAFGANGRDLVQTESALAGFDIPQGRAFLLLEYLESFELLSTAGRGRPDLPFSWASLTSYGRRVLEGRDAIPGLTEAY